MITFRLKSSVWSFICLCIISIGQYVGFSSIFIMQLWLFYFIRVIFFSLLQFFFYVPMSMYIFHTRIQHNRNYGWLCLLFSYGVMCWITLFIWLWWLSEDLYFGICLDSPWSVFGCAAYFRKWPNNHKASW